MGRNRFAFGRLVVVAMFGASMAGCATDQSGRITASGEAGTLLGASDDPLEFVNRFTFAFNDALDTVIFQPAAATYRMILPDVVQDSVQNFMRNWNAPVTLANDLMQFEWERAEATAIRFVSNSTLGVGGLFDVAEDWWGVTYHDEDFGQTLAVWGVGEGFYLVLPIIGPSSLRDGVGIVADSFISPWPYVLDYATDLSDDTISAILFGRLALEGIDQRARNIETIDAIRADAVDYYARIRSFWRQNREQQILNGRVDEIPLPEFIE